MGAKIINNVKFALDYQDMNSKEARTHFPQLNDKVYGKNLVYLDNAATSLRPQEVVDKWCEMSLHSNANIHRAVHLLAQEATSEFESTREFVAEYLNAQGIGKVIFTSGATASVNTVASCFALSELKAGDEILIAGCEHHSDIVPWQMACQRTGAVIKVLPVMDNGTLDLEELSSMLVPGRTRLFCVAHVSNVLGIENPVREITRICHSAGCAVLVDGAQGIVHCKVDLKELDCDFYVFSGHKVYAAPGTGVLFMKNWWAEKLPPFMGGGEMISTVRWEGTTYSSAPGKFEAGTQNIAGVPTLKPALQLCSDMEYDSTVTKYVMESLGSRGDIRVFGTPDDIGDKVPLFSFCVEGVHHEDLALILDKMGIAVRSGQMCAEPLMDRFGVTGMLRASFAPYNTLEEAEFFIDSLGRAIQMLK